MFSFTFIKLIRKKAKLPADLLKFAVDFVESRYTDMTIDKSSFSVL